MGRHLVTLLSDLHLSAKRGYAVPGFDACAAAIRSLSPDLAVVAGDLVLDDPDDDDDRAFAHGLIERLGPAHAVVPGNHDVGDNVPEPWMGQAITQERLDAWLALHGDDRFSIDIGAWRLVGIDVQLLDTGLSREEEQWTWIAEVARDAGRRPIALVTHKPLVWRSESDPDGPNHLTRGTRERLFSALGGARVGLFLSGHLHQHRMQTLRSVPAIWAPSAALIGRDHGFGVHSEPQPGLLLLTFEDEEVAVAVLRPDAGGGVDAAALMKRHGPPRGWPAMPDAHTAAQETEEGWR